MCVILYELCGICRRLMNYDRYGTVSKLATTPREAIVVHLISTSVRPASTATSYAMALLHTYGIVAGLVHIRLESVYHTYRFHDK